MCGAPVTQGFLCAKCDKPRKLKAPAASSAATATSPAAPVAAAATALIDDFPKSAIVPLPVESAAAITSLANVLMAAGSAAVVIGADRAVKFVTAEMRKLFTAAQADLSTLAHVERLASLKVGDLGTSATWTLPIRNLIATLVPLSSGAGAVLVFRPAEPLPDDMTTRSRAPKVTDVLRTVADRFVPFAELKGIRLQIDAPELDERFKSHDELADAIGVLLDNSLHYVPPGGQVVAGVRMMDHKGKPLLLFFVMDNGSLVPGHMRQVIFEQGFVWIPAARERTGRGLSKVRDFAVRHGGSVWTEAKSGKACTFFLRVRPDAR